MPEPDKESRVRVLYSVLLKIPKKTVNRWDQNQEQNLSSSMLASIDTDITKPLQNLFNASVLDYELYMNHILRRTKLPKLQNPWLNL